MYFYQCGEQGANSPKPACKRFKEGWPETGEIIQRFEKMKRKTFFVFTWTLKGSQGSFISIEIT